MAIVELSSTALSQGIALAFSPTNPLGAASGNQSTSLAAGSFFPTTSQIAIPDAVIGIHIMQGTVPTNFSGFTTYAASGRASDRLVYFNGTDTFTVGTSGARASISTTFVAATQSGTATWFWAIGTMTDGISTSTIYQQFIGTVGLAGSGADLTITGTSIVSGNTYRVASLLVSVPSTYTV